MFITYLYFSYLCLCSHALNDKLSEVQAIVHIIPDDTSKNEEGKQISTSDSVGIISEDNTLTELNGVEWQIPLQVKHSSGSSERKEFLQIIGRYSRANMKSSKQVMRGRVIAVEACGEAENKRLDIKKEAWIAVLYEPFINRATLNVNKSACAFILERVREAMLLGASAIIILSINPKLLKELEQTYHTSVLPMIIVEDYTDIVNIVKFAGRNISLTAVVYLNATIYSTMFFSTLTLWATCGRANSGSYHEWEGVVCMGKQDAHRSNHDQGDFWSVFYTLLFTFLPIMLFLAKVHDADTEEDSSKQKARLYRLAERLIADMRTRRYPRRHFRNRSNVDRCAVCLDDYKPRQKLRVLPCFHEFHKVCVDPWLLEQRTCPLCKFHIIRKDLDLED